MNQRVLDIDGTMNFRDLGGYRTGDGRTVKWRSVYRSAQLDRLSPQGVTALAAIGVRTVVDLRFSDETVRYPTLKAAVPDAEILSWHDEREADSGEKSDKMIRSWGDSLASNDPAMVREAMRINYPQKLYTHRAIYRKMLIRLASGQTPLLFHCAAGKDRTGVAAALILSLLGVNDEQIVADYLLTQREIEGRMETWIGGGATSGDRYQDFQSKLAQHPAAVLKPIFDADRTYIETLLEYIEATYGGFAGYAEQRLLLSEDLLLSLKKSLLN